MEKITIEAVHRRDLTQRDFIGIHEVMQDMWASEAGLGEFVQCKCCNKMISKEQVFGHLPKELTQETVSYLIQLLGAHSIPCTSCGGETRMIYGPENVEKLKDRILGSVNSFLVLCKTENKGIVGFEEGYVDSLNRMFDLDFMDHYGDVGLHEITGRVEKTLGYVPDEMLLTSSLGLLEPYRNFQNLFGIMKRFAMILPDNYMGMPGITELDREGVTHRMSKGINDGISLGIEDNPELRAKMTRVGEKYNCDLIVYPNYIKTLKNNFIMEPREFVRMIQGKPRVRNTALVNQSTRERVSHIVPAPVTRYSEELAFA